MDKQDAKEKLSRLITKYKNTVSLQNRSEVSEATVRSWLNEFLEIFGWDIKNIRQVQQENTLNTAAKQRLDEIESSHNRPDYTLMNGTNIKTFIDTKRPVVDIFNDKVDAFQIRSYGWSAQVPCAFLFNFEQLAIFDTTFMPNLDQPCTWGMKQFTVDEYLSYFDEIYEYLDHDLICSNHLEELYSINEKEGKNKVDQRFTELLCRFREKIAENLLKNNRSVITDNELLNYYTQVILDRIVFIRVCESKEIEKKYKLRQFMKDKFGTWNAFKNSCYMEFYKHYDGAMFERDERFQTLYLDDECIDSFINELYYPSPYCFDVIPVKVIASIYEEFLEKQLIIKNNNVVEVTKDEYIKSNGIVITPSHIVDMVVKQTVKLDTIHTVSDLLSIKILDPCCGSGIFLVSCYERLSSKLIEILDTDIKERNRYSNYCISNNRHSILTIEGRREIIKNCLHGIDRDEAAVEVTKMSLALKLVDGNDPLIWEYIGAFGDKILREIAVNVVLGNSLVTTDNEFSSNQVIKIQPLNIKKVFLNVFEKGSGFSYVLGNPPYVETKYYKEAEPEMHEYLRKKYFSFSGKADLAVLFMERGMQLLKRNGKLGYIIQRRWFRTEYGKNIRLLINREKYLEQLIDFEATDIFKGRLVYASIIILGKNEHDSSRYYYMPGDASVIKEEFENSDEMGYFPSCHFTNIPNQTGGEPWSFDTYEITSLRVDLTEKLGTLSQFPHLEIKDGIQALYKKIYHITNVTFKNDLAFGQNGLGQKVVLERNVLRNIIYNKLFYPFKNVTPDAYCIFPYEGASNNPISFWDMKKRFPRTAAYLLANKPIIEKHSRCREGDLWHTFTREHNQKLYNVDKIIVPMTAKDTIATFVSNQGLYMDNANVWFIRVTGATKELMEAITCIINSTIFSVLGKAGANPQSGGYYKFNKQFLAPIPFPIDNLSNDKGVEERLSNLYHSIYYLQEKYILATPNRKKNIAFEIQKQWEILDSICYRLYNVSEDEMNLIKKVGRTVDRIDLLNGV